MPSSLHGLSHIIVGFENLEIRCFSLSSMVSHSSSLLFWYHDIGIRCTFSSWQKWLISIPLPMTAKRSPHLPWPLPFRRDVAAAKVFHVAWIGLRNHRQGRIKSTIISVTSVQNVKKHSEVISDKFAQSTDICSCYCESHDRISNIPPFSIPLHPSTVWHSKSTIPSQISIPLHLFATICITH